MLPFGNRTVIETLTGAQLTEALLNGFSPGVQPGDRHRPLPAGLGAARSTFHCDGTTPVIAASGKAPDGPGGPLTPIGPTDTVRIVTNDFMFTRRRRLHGVRRAARTCSSRATRCSTWRSSTSRA